MRVHIAIVTAPYDQLILAGRKTVECRLTRQPRPPFGCIAPGDRIHFKRSGGPFFAVASVDRVWMTDRLTPTQIAEIRRRYNPLIHGRPDYWRSRRDCAFATLIWLRDVTPDTTRPNYRPQNMRAWYTLDPAACGLAPLSPKRSEAPDPSPDPAARGLAIPDIPDPNPPFEIQLTLGAIRQHQIRLTKVIDRFPAESVGGATRADTAAHLITLNLQRGPTVATDIVGPRKMFRYRGWAPWFAQCGLRPGDRIRFVPTGLRTFDVLPVPKGAP